MLMYVLTLPQTSFVAGGIVAGITIYLIDSLKDKYETRRKRLLDASIGALSAMAICWLSHRFFPEKFIPIDSIPYSVGIAVLGVGRVFRGLAKRMGLEISDGGDLEDEQKN